MTTRYFTSVEFINQAANIFGKFVGITVEQRETQIWSKIHHSLEFD